MSSSYIQVVTSIDSKEGADAIAQATVEERLASCAQIIGPIDSIYWWQGKMERAKEWLCVIKSEQRMFSELNSLIERLHPYEVPEVLAVPVIKGNRHYLEWLSSELKGGS